MFRIGREVKIHKTARINVQNGVIGDRSVIGANAVIEGREVRIGHEAWIGENAHIGGGSCQDPSSVLVVGDFLHMGPYSHLNQCRGLRIGHEFGCGMGTKVFTHGAYESAWDGFPVQWQSVSIGDRVWLPNAWVNPGVKIGNDVVVAAMSLVNKDLPDGCLAGGIPCRIIKHGAYPRRLGEHEKGELFERIFQEAVAIFLTNRRGKATALSYQRISEDVFSVGKTIFDLSDRRIEGEVTDFTQVLKNQLRRNGIRFRYTAENGVYVRWK